MSLKRPPGETLPPSTRAGVLRENIETSAMRTSDHSNPAWRGLFLTYAWRTFPANLEILLPRTCRAFRSSIHGPQSNSDWRSDRIRRHQSRAGGRHRADPRHLPPGRRRYARPCRRTHYRHDRPRDRDSPANSPGRPREPGARGVRHSSSPRRLDSDHVRPCQFGQFSITCPPTPSRPRGQACQSRCGPSHPRAGLRCRSVPAWSQADHVVGRWLAGSIV